VKWPLCVLLAYCLGKSSKVYLYEAAQWPGLGPQLVLKQVPSKKHYMAEKNVLKLLHQYENHCSLYPHLVQYNDGALLLFVYFLSHF
jgi:hypothetical protein